MKKDEFLNDETNRILSERQHRERAGILARLRFLMMTLGLVSMLCSLSLACPVSGDPPTGGGHTFVPGDAPSGV